MQVFYEEATSIVTAWHPNDTKRPLRDGEVKVYLEILPPKTEGASVRDYICDGATLKLRPDFVPPRSRDVLEEIDAINAKIDALYELIERRM